VISRKHFFVDEAGNLDFSSGVGASKYFILTSATMESCDEAEALLNLRRALVWNGHPLTDAFHATTDKQAVRDEVYAAIVGMDIRIDSTIIPKASVPLDKQALLDFYKLAWFLHAQRAIPSNCAPSEELFVIAASIGTRRERLAIKQAIQDVVQHCGRNEENTRIAFWPALSDACLQVAEYCCWAIQRKWERNDKRSYELIQPLIASEEEIVHLG
jgi:hypothetical protein